ncbi:DUF1707 domain-containing protein [Streptomyces sp. SID8379]|uniref:DUF1707 SHOCT-like domain-containing protein n=1 Tax=unclassified Streptomyces TaxID=2593676 RepID=UPI000373F72C|nr:MULTISPECIES: DUF1707 domain-containing protein [unclassified Streptomyces]MYW66061.1 DUF1707 domain-containing protein [Streptomyces sp. SID8379]
MTDASLPDRPDASNPSDDGLDLRASDADREQVAERLRDAMAEGRLDMDEFTERLEETYKARTYRELAPITRDLPGAGAPAPAPAPVNLVKGPLPEGAVDWAARIGGEAGGSAWGVGILSGFERKGRWTAPRRFDCVAVMGGGELDLREANFEDREIVINCVAIMGGVNVIVPPGVEVVVRGIGIMGGFDHSESGVAGDPGAPRVIVTGFAFWGGVGVERKVTRAERQRLKEERRRDKLERREGRRELLEGHHDRHRHLHEDRVERHRERVEEHLDRLEERRERRRRGRHWD